MSGDQLGNISLFLEDTQPINLPVEPLYAWFTLSQSLVTIILNSWGMVVMWTKESSGINNLLIWDFFISSVFMVETVVNNSPWYKLELNLLCSIHNGALDGDQYYMGDKSK